MTTNLQDRPDTLENSGDEERELCHIVCTTDKDTALCGLDVSNDDWEGETNKVPIYCQVCEDLDELLVCPICKQIH